MQSNCKLYAFFKATGGNWRNAIYISCDLNTCPFGHRCTCKGFFLVANEDGYPLAVGVQDYMYLTKEPIDPEECRGILSRQAFESMYELFLQWHVELPSDCPLHLLSKQNTGCL